LIEIGKKSGIHWFANDLTQTLSQFSPLHIQNLTWFNAKNGIGFSVGLMAIQVP